MVSEPPESSWHPEFGSGAVIKSRPLGIEIERERPGRRHRHRGASRRPALFALLGLLALGVVVGIGAGLQPLATLVLVVGGVGAVAVLLRLEWAALLVVGTAVFEDYLVVVDPRVVKLSAVLLIGSWLIERAAGPAPNRSRSGTLVAALFFVVALLLATVVHNNGMDGLVVLLRYAGFLAVLAVLIDAMRRGLAPARVARVYVASCGLAAAFGLAGYFLREDRRIGGPINDPNDFAFFLLAAVPLALALHRMCRGAGRRSWPWDIALGLIVLALVGTLSRGALVGLAVMVLIALLAGMVRLRSVVAVGVLVGTALSLTAALFPHLVDVSLQQKSHVAGQNVSERLQLWEAAGQMTLESPVVGLGPGSFSLRHRDYMGTLPLDVTHTLDVAHNTYLELSSELGLLGLFSFVAILVTAMVGGWSRWKLQADPLAGATAVALVGTMAASFFLTEQYFLPLWLLSALGASLAVRRGLLEGATVDERSGPPVPTSA